MTKKILAAILAVMMIVSMLPTALAAEAELKCPGVDAKHNKDNCDYVRVEEEPIVEPDCCTPGYTLYACEKCGEYFASDIKEPLGDCQKELVAEEVPATCGVEGTTAVYRCGKNGTLYGGEPIEALEHDWVHSNGDCTVAHTKTCNNCDKTEEVAAAPGHSWETGFSNLSIAIKTEPTLTTDGVFVYVCQNGECKAESPEYPIHAHEHTYDRNAGKAETCTAAGVKPHFTCSYNGCEMLFVLDGNDYKAVSAADLVIEAHEHSFVDAGDVDAAGNPYNYDEWNTFIDNTCQTSGYTLRKCTECEKWYEEEHTDADPEKHTWQEVEPAVTGTCDVKGKTAVKYCKVCRIVVGGDEIEGTGEGHAEQTVTFAGNCTEKAYTYTYCTNEFCTLDKKSLTDGEKEIYKDLRIISSQLGAVNPAVHTLGWVVTQEATCVAPGHKIWACTACKGEGTATGVYEAIEIGDAENGGHVWIKDSNADCLNAEKWHCGLCNSKDYADAEAALGHTSKLADGTEAEIKTKYPTCNANGTGNAGYTYQECTRCGTEINKTAIEYNTTYIYDDETDARNQHDLAGNTPKEYKAGNCTEKGLWTLGECARCNRTVLLTMEGTGEGHKQPETGVTAPTCTTVGSYTCENPWCENENKLVVIPALGHTLTYVEGSAATCDTDGEKAHWECTTCHGNFVASDWVISDDKTTITNVTLAALSGTFVGAQHPGLNTLLTGSASGIAVSFVVKEETVDGTYTYVTADSEYTIIIEDGLFKAALVKTAESQVITKLGHMSFTMTDSVDCEQYGYRLVYCFRCHKSDMYDYVPELGHKMSEESIFTSCVTDKIFVCEQEGGCAYDYYEVDEGTAPGHENSDGDFFWEGCLDTEDNRYCVVCEAEISNEHELYVKIDDAPATCTQPGYDLVVCEVCDFEEIIINEEPLDHDWILNGECTDKSFAPTVLEPGNEHYCCSRCNECKDEEVPVYEGVEFTLSVDNAVVPGANNVEIDEDLFVFVPVDSDVIAVDIYMNAFEIDVRGFNFNVYYDYNSLNYLGYVYHVDDLFGAELINNNVEYGEEYYPIGNTLQHITWVEDAYVSISAYAENTPDGAKNEVEVTGTIKVATLYFQVEAYYTDYTIDGIEVGGDMDDDAYVEIGDIYMNNADGDEFGAMGDDVYFPIDVMMDSNWNGFYTVQDLTNCYDIIKGVSDYAYLAGCDADKDGQITADDLVLMHQFLGGVVDEFDIYDALKWTAPEGFVG